MIALALALSGPAWALPSDADAELALLEETAALLLQEAQADGRGDSAAAIARRLEALGALRQELEAASLDADPLDPDILWATLERARRLVAEAAGPGVAALDGGPELLAWAEQGTAELDALMAEVGEGADGGLLTLERGARESAARTLAEGPLPGERAEIEARKLAIALARSHELAERGDEPPSPGCILPLFEIPEDEDLWLPPPDVGDLWFDPS